MAPRPLIVGFGRPDEYLAVGDGGWAHVHRGTDDDPAIGVYVRITERPDGRLIIFSVVVDLPIGITGRALDGLPLGRIEAAINMPVTAKALRPRLKADAFSPFDELINIAPPAFGATAEVDFPLRIKGARAAGKRPDEFYAAVATAFSGASLTTSKPAEAIARANSVPVTTVHRWVKEARRRGLLAPARRAAHGGVNTLDTDNTRGDADA